jgi:hypothetical protein
MTCIEMGHFLSQTCFSQMATNVRKKTMFLRDKHLECTLCSSGLLSLAALKVVTDVSEEHVAQYSGPKMIETILSSETLLT